MKIFLVIMTIASLIAGILGIILFFKVWRMCNDVAEMNERLGYVLLSEEEKMAKEWQRKHYLGEVK